MAAIRLAVSTRAQAQSPEDAARDLLRTSAERWKTAVAPHLTVEIALDDCGPQLQLAASALQAKFAAEVAFVPDEDGALKLRDPHADDVIVWEGEPRVEIPHPEVGAVKMGLLLQHFTYRLAGRLNEWIGSAQAALPSESGIAIYPIFAVMPEVPFNKFRWSAEELRAGFRVSTNAFLDPGDGTPDAARVIATDTHTALPPELMPKFKAPEYEIQPVLVEISGFAPVSDDTRTQIENIADQVLAKMFGTGFSSGIRRTSFKNSSNFAEVYDGLCSEIIGAEIDSATGGAAEKDKIFSKVKEDFKASKAKAAVGGDPNLAVLRGIIEKVREDESIEPSARNGIAGRLHPLIGMMRSSNNVKVMAKIDELLPSLPGAVAAELEGLRDSLRGPNEARPEGQ